MLKSLLFCLALLASALPAHAAENEPPQVYTLSFKTPEGQTYALSQHRGEVLLINFWATWCPPCVREMPELNKLNAAFADQPFNVIAISVGESAADITTFESKLQSPVSLPILLDSDGRAFTEFNLKGLPMSYLFDREGNLVEVIIGPKEWASEEWQNRIKALLAAAP